MKRFFKILILMTFGLISSATMFAQSPEKMTYQAVIRDAANNLIANQPVGMQISILQDAVNGTVVFKETHAPTTNAVGLVNLEIGSGTILIGSMAVIDWANGPYFIKTETDPNGGTNYTITGTTQLLSVPYALYAKTAGVAHSVGQTVILNDSLVLKDSLGVTRMVLNPNTGTFKMMNNDTVWYKMSVNSPKIDYLQLDGGKYLVTKEENGAQIFELYQNANLIGRQTETKDYDGSSFSTTRTSVTEDFGLNPNTGTYQKVSETKNEDVSYLNIDDHYSSITTKLFNNGQLREETSIFKKYQNTPGIVEHTETTHNKVYDNQGDVLRETKVVKDLINNTKKTYIKAFGDYCLVEEKNDPLAFEQTITVEDSSGNGTSSKLAKDKFAVSNSNPNAKSIEYSYDNTTHTTQLNYVDAVNTKTNIATMDNLGNVEYGPNNAIKTNKFGETFLSNNTYVVGDLMTIGNTDVYGNLNVSGTKNFRITHPNDTSKYLVHAALESNEVLNVYSGNAVTDNQGLATVSLPDYFDEINTDFRYVLTVVGQTFAQAIIYQEINSKNQFEIKTSEPFIKVSWQVIARRADNYMNKHPFHDVIDK